VEPAVPVAPESVLPTSPGAHPAVNPSASTPAANSESKSCEIRRIKLLLEKGK
jgi:hypothetical protein